MPYVEVWVDKEPCDGSCESADELRKVQAKIDEAERLLRAGEPVAALHALTDDETLPVKSPAEIAENYKLWKEGKLPGWTSL